MLGDPGSMFANNNPLRAELLYFYVPAPAAHGFQVVAHADHGFGVRFVEEYYGIARR